VNIVEATASCSRPLPTIHVGKADLSNQAHTRAIMELLNDYAEDPMGGGEALSEYTRENLIAQLQQRSNLLALIAFDDDIPTGLIISFEGFSTFHCAPLLKGTSRNSLQPLRYVFSPGSKHALENKPCLHGCR